MRIKFKRRESIQSKKSLKVFLGRLQSIWTTATTTTIIVCFTSNCLRSLWSLSFAHQSRVNLYFLSLFSIDAIWLWRMLLQNRQVESKKKNFQYKDENIRNFSSFSLSSSLDPNHWPSFNANFFRNIIIIFFCQSYSHHRIQTFQTEVLWILFFSSSIRSSVFPPMTLKEIDSETLVLDAFIWLRFSFLLISLLVV